MFSMHTNAIYGVSAECMVRDGFIHESRQDLGCARLLHGARLQLIHYKHSAYMITGAAHISHHGDIRNLHSNTPFLSACVAHNINQLHSLSHAHRTAITRTSWNDGVRGAPICASMNSVASLSSRSLAMFCCTQQCAHVTTNRRRDARDVMHLVAVCGR